MPSSKATSHEFFSMIPRRSVMVFFAAVFFIFSPMGLLLGSSFAQRRPLHTVLLAALISGCIAVSWAATFTISRRWIAGIVVFSALQIVFFGPMQDTSFGIGSARASLEGFGIVAAIVAGYALFIVFISGQGRRALRLQTEMALARRIHETLVPRLELNRPGFELLGVSRASSEMGGDLVDAVPHGETTDVVVADVSGHGVVAGVVMGMVKSALRTSLLTPAPLSRLLESLNHVLEETTSPEMYSTFVVLRIGSDGTPIEYALAAHHHILHYRAGDRQVRSLQQRQLPLGLMPGGTFQTGLTTVAPGDLLAVYTDGINETENEAGEQLGHEPIGHYIAGCADAPLSRIQEGLFDLARRHGAPADDQTILLVRIK
jgi:serine phosphatase RsbU (regulator of sigma subunit)